MLRLLLLALSLIAPASASGARPAVISMVTDVPTVVSSGMGDEADALFCDSWRLSVETANAGPWSAVPARCAVFVGDYMQGPRYASDSAVVAADSIAFASDALATAGWGGASSARPAWVFDIDETLLSNAPYYAVNGWGCPRATNKDHMPSGISMRIYKRLQAFNETSFDEWVDTAKAPALPSSLKLYNELQGLGFHIILLTGRSEFQRNSTEANLLFAGYNSWEKLILRQSSDIGKTAVQYKSERRAAMEAEGFKILGSSGDQWSDLIGSPMATRSFKLPNPMYFIS